MQDFAYIVRDSVIPYITSNAKHVLDHLASREGENGEAWPSTKTISDCTNISMKGVQRAINQLLENHLITRTSGKLLGRSNRYKVTLPLELVQIYADQHPQKRIRVKDYAPQEVGRADLPTVGHGDARGRTIGADGVGRPDLRSKSILCENKTTDTQKDVCKSVSLSTAPQQPTIQKLPRGRFSVDRTFAARTCYDVGASNEEAYKFWRYNQTRGWPLLATMELIDVARRWRDTWRREHPDEYEHEQDVRRAAKERRELSKTPFS